MGKLLGVAGRAVIRRTNGRVLLIRRHERASTDPGLWELPGGKVDFGERLYDALIREVAEETGITVKPGEVLHIGHRLVEPFWVTVVTSDCGVTDHDVVLSGEHSAHVWATPGEADRLPLGEGSWEQIEAWSAHYERVESG